MGNLEIRQFLKDKLLSGDERYISVSQIRAHFIEHPNPYVSLKNISMNITWLKHMGQLEAKKVDKITYYRFSKRVLEQSTI